MTERKSIIVKDVLHEVKETLGEHAVLISR